MILLIRTDKPEAELYMCEKTECIDSTSWQAHRELAETIHEQIRDLFKRHKLTWSNISAIGCYQGPGSFTGLRIGLSVANALADSLEVSIVGASGDDWKEQCLRRLEQNIKSRTLIPDYGRPAHITRPRK